MREWQTDDGTPELTRAVGECCVRGTRLGVLAAPAPQPQGSPQVSPRQKGWGPYWEGQGGSHLRMTVPRGVPPGPSAPLKGFP